MCSCWPGEVAIVTVSHIRESRSIGGLIDLSDLTDDDRRQRKESAFGRRRRRGDAGGVRQTSIARARWNCRLWPIDVA
jgi:hypothetical protein